MPTRLGRTLGWLYAQVAGLRNGWYDVNPGKRADRPVISIGNLSAGGTGKTPMVAHLVQTLKDAGRSPCIAMRGYKSATGSPADSDEAQQYARILPGIPLAVGPNRLEELKVLFTTSRGAKVDCVLLDDGFQHRQLWRDCDLVLIDATRPPFDDSQLPGGFLREPLIGLKRAHGIVLTHAEAVPAQRISELSYKIEDLTGRRPVAVCRHAWKSLVTGEGTKERTVPPDFIKGRKIALGCAIGNPGPLVAHVKSIAEIVHEAVLPDHDPFSGKTLDAFIRGAKEKGADLILVTEKDWSKLRTVPEDRWPCPVLRPRLALSFDRGMGDVADLVIGAVRAWKRP
jgi:tetraacyldisaccharide 4'-kinase